MTANPLFRLDGQVAIVTGSSRGIGRAIAEEMARAGAKVVISSRKLDACEAVRDALVAEGLEAIVIACNTGRKGDLENLVATTMERFGRIDHVVANVAVNPYYGPMAGASDDVWSKIMDTNVRATWWLANLTLPHVAAAGGGTFTTISSIGAMRGNKVIGLYNVSKIADIGLTLNLAAEWGANNIRVNAIAPGLVRTDFARALWENPQWVAAIEKGTPLGRIGEPIDIAGVAVFLAAPASRHITGQVITADGGTTIVGLGT